VRQGFEVLQKPYDMAALERALRAARKSADKTVTDADAAPRRAAG
jgi:hypothetical protein